MTTLGQHVVTLVAGGRELPGWTEYSISRDMLQPADAFTVSARFTREAYALLQPDAEVTVYLDDVVMLTGFIDSVTKRPGTVLEVVGRDRCGRLVDESAPLFTYGGLHLRELVEKIVGLDESDPLFQRVELVNTANRSLLRNVKARQARVAVEPLVPASGGVFRSVARPSGIHVDTGLRIDRPPLIDPGILRGRAVPKRVTPGATRWQVLEMFLAEARLIAWSSGDGRTLFVGTPNHDGQDPQWFFFEAAVDSSNRDQSNCAITVVEDNTNLYSQITAVGAARGTGTSYGANVTKNRASVYDNPANRTDGTGRRFQRRKRLLITDDSVKSARDALERAEREQLEREASSFEVEIEAPGHSQTYGGDVPALYTIDTIARVIDEDTGTDGLFIVTACDYGQTASGGTKTTLRAVPRGTLITL